MREYLVVFLVAAAVTYLLTVVAREIALRTGAVARSATATCTPSPTPYLGGLAMLGGLFAAFLVARELPFLSGSQPCVFERLALGARRRRADLRGRRARRHLRARRADQVRRPGARGRRSWSTQASSSVCFPSRTASQFCPRPDPGRPADRVLIVLTTVNAVNFVDGLDGLAAGVSASGRWPSSSSATSSRSTTSVARATTGALLSAALAGACAGFLPHNFHPGPAVHGRQRLDADRAGALGRPRSR